MTSPKTFSKDGNGVPFPRKQGEEEDEQDPKGTRVRPPLQTAASGLGSAPFLPQPVTK
jgi:hypothetical protein